MSKLTLSRGNTEVLSGAVVNPNGSPTDLTGATATLYIKLYQTDADSAAVFTKVISSGLTTDGLISFSLSPANTSNLPFYGDKSYHWIVKVVAGSGDTYTVDQGTLTVEN